MIDTGIAFLAGLGIWTALQMYYWGREPGKVPDRKTVCRDYVTQLKTAKGKLLLLAGIMGMVCCFYLAEYYGLPYINCVRNEAVFLWLMPVALIDAKEHIIPHALTMPGFAAWVLLVLLAVSAGGSSLGAVLLFSLGGCLLGGGVFFLCRLISGGGVGMGDIRVFGILGLLYGMNATFSIVFFTILIMSVYGFGAVLCGKKGMKSQVPMGPFIMASYLLCCLLGV